MKHKRNKAVHILNINLSPKGDSQRKRTSLTFFSKWKQ